MAGPGLKEGRGELWNMDGLFFFILEVFRVCFSNNAVPWLLSYEILRYLYFEYQGILFIAEILRFFQFKIWVFTNQCFR